MSAATNVRPSSVTLEVGVIDLGQPEHLGGVDERQEVVDLEGQIVGEFRQILAPAVGDEDLEKTGHAADGGLRAMACRPEIPPPASPAVQMCAGGRVSRPVMRP